MPAALGGSSIGAVSSSWDFGEGYESARGSACTRTTPHERFLTVASQRSQSHGAPYVTTLITEAI
jgi:hypothetical protein